MSPDLKLVNGDGRPSSLPVGETLKMLFGFLRTHAGDLFKIAIIPTALILVTFAGFGAFSASTEPASPFAMLPSTLITGALMAMIMVATGRMALFGDAPERFSLPVFGRTEMLTWAGSILSSIITVVLVGILAALVLAMTGSAPFAILVAVVPALVIVAALSLIYPLILTTGRLDFRQAVQTASGHLPRLCAVLFIASLVTVFVCTFAWSLVLGAAAALFAEEAMLAFTTRSSTVFMVLVQVLTAIVNIAAISYAFRWIDYYSPQPLLKSE